MNWFFSRRSHRCLISLFLFIMLAGFLIFNDGGFVAVKDEDSGIVQRTGYSVSMLPEADAEALNRGIHCDDARALAVSYTHLTLPTKA